MAEKPEVEVVNPPHDIRQKVSGGGGISDEMLRRAEHAIADMSAGFMEGAAADVEKLRQLYQDAKGNPDKRPEIIGEIFQISHDLRGQGSTFDYPLLSRVGSSLCTFTETIDSANDKSFEIIGIHIDALRVIIGQNVTGDGGPLGREIAAELETAVKKIVS